MTRTRDIADQQKNLGGAVPGFTAGKNKIINGDFGVWQRGISATSSSGFMNTTYLADRWVTYYYGGGNTANYVMSQQALTPGSIPGYESPFYIRHAFPAGNASTYWEWYTRIEDVRTLAGMVSNFSYWIRNSGTIQVGAIEIMQNFGTGGSSTVYTYVSQPSATSSWSRISTSFTMPSITGKTIGTGSYIQVKFYFGPTGSSVSPFNIDIWGTQLEAGSVATPFTTATGNPALELLACQKYYEKSYPYANFPGSTTSQQGLVNYQAVTSTAINNRCWVPFLVSKRTDSPTITIYNYNNGASGYAYNESTGVYSVAIQFQSNRGFNLYPTSGTFSAGQVCNFYYTAESEL